MGVGWSEVGVEGVPLELVYRVLRHVSLRDLTTLSATSLYLKNLIDESPLLWSHVHTQDLWPNVQTSHWFERAARCGNVSASIKLVVALLYNEGVRVYSVNMGNHQVVNGVLAVTLFEHLETGGSLGPWSQLWLLYRPPWGAHGLCCKRYVHTRISHIAEMTGVAWGNRVLSRISEVTGEDVSNSFGVNWIKVAAQGGDVHARLLQWRSRYERRHVEGALDPGTELQASRELRELCLTGYYPANLTLAQFLVSSRHPSDQCLSDVREFLQSSPPSRTWCALNYQQHVTPHMHHVLVDWLCEVTNMKLHSSAVIHAASQILESYLSVEQVKCTQLQLVGITAVLLATRFIPGAPILTIREASWITDNTYSYNHVVRMIGNIMAALSAILALPTILDYATVVMGMVRVPDACREWTHFICDLATTCSFPPRTTLAQIGSSCVLLGYILSRSPCPNLPAMTGFTQHQLLQPALIIYCKIFDVEGGKCQRLGILDRYSMAKFSPMQVGLQPVPHLEEFLATLALTESDYLSFVIFPQNFGDDASGHAMDTDAVGRGVQCSGTVYRSQKVQEGTHKYFHAEGSNPHGNTQPGLQSGSQSSGSFAGRIDSNSGGSSSSRSSFNNSNENPSASGIKPSVQSRSEDSKMEFSDGETSPSTQKSNSPQEQVERSGSWNVRTGAFLDVQQGKDGSPLDYSLYKKESHKPSALSAAPSDMEDSRPNSSNSRHSESPLVDLMPSEEMYESLNETVSSEESSELLLRSCDGAGTNSARVNLKRKLEHSPDGVTPEKCLLLDENLQMD